MDATIESLFLLMSYIDDPDRLKKTHYEVLGIERDADILAIKSAYRQKLLTTHPDKIKQNGNASNENVNALQLAFKVLSDKSLRGIYDESLQKSTQRAGFNISGEGLDSYSLDEFECIEEDEICYYKNCPRCLFPRSIRLTEVDLENGTDDGCGGYNLIVQCDSCSLWLIVKYFEEESGDDI